MSVAQERVRSQVSESFDIAARLKSTGTIIEKLRRSTRLSSMQDIAGIRARGKMTLDEQTALANQMRRTFGDAEIVDRRAAPSHGYRAVHVIATVEDCLIEIQIRTHLQDLWAQLVEKLGDMWGRQIRYGGLPDDPDAAVPSIGAHSRRAVFEVAMTLSDQIAGVELRQNQLAEMETEVGAVEDQLGDDPEDSALVDRIEDLRDNIVRLKAEADEAEEALRLVLVGLTESLE